MVLGEVTGGFLPFCLILCLKNIWVLLSSFHVRVQPAQISTMAISSRRVPQRLQSSTPTT